LCAVKYSSGLDQLGTWHRLLALGYHGISKLNSATV
jgi:hypothetical protein